MPKGVEHIHAPAMPTIAGSVPNSVMPKGVEHLLMRSRAASRHCVSNSVMPKGVEHIARATCSDSLGQLRVEFSDAERR